MSKTCRDCKLAEPAVLFYRKANRCTECQKSFMKKYRAESKLDALVAYGGVSPICACDGCDENRLPFLTIDHVDGGGNLHRARLAGINDFQVGNPALMRGGKINPGGGAFYRWLKKNNYPPGFQVLCYNCNMARGTGDCPVHIIPILIST